jgi:hypothetical protein
VNIARAGALSSPEKPRNVARAEDRAVSDATISIRLARRAHLNRRSFRMIRQSPQIIGQQGKRKRISAEEKWWF